MSQLPVEQGLTRFKENEERLDNFVNSPTGYTTSGGTPVESVPAFILRKEAEIDAVDAINVTQTNKQATESARDRAETAAENALLFSTAAGDALGFINKASLSALNADLAHAADTLAYVSADPVLSNNGIYRKVGASGSGSWIWSVLTPNLLLTPLEPNGDADELYNSSTFSGWGAIVTTGLTRIARISIKRGAAKASWNQTSFNLKLYGLTSPLTNLTTATLIQSFSVPVATWNALNEGDDYVVSLTNPVSGGAYPFFAVTVSSDVAGQDWINIQQTGDNGAVSIGSERFVYGNYRVLYNGAWTSIGGGDNYGLWFTLFDRSDLSLQDTLAEQQAEIDRIRQAAFVLEENGVAGSTYQYPIFGWGVILNTSLSKISTVVLRRHTGTNTYTNAYLTVKLLELSTATVANINSGATVVQEFQVPCSEWYGLSDGDDLYLDLSSEYSVVLGKSYAVVFYSSFATRDPINVKQTGDETTSGPSFVDGVYLAEGSSNWTYTNGAGGQGSYGLWVRLESKVASEQLPVSVTQNLPTLLDNYFKALPLAENPLKSLPTFNQHWLRQDKDTYAVVWGDSISAWQSTMDKAPEGVTQVPAVCDRQGLAYRFWKHYRFGNPQYRRFDHGKNALVGAWDTSWAGGDAAFFTEGGTWVTHYYSDAGGNAGSISSNYNHPSYTTLITNASCPVGAFHNVENQRNIPKRLSGSSGASVSFVIPAGFEKADFIYHTHTQGDDSVTITVTGGNGKLLYKESNVAWGGAEANGHVFSMRETQSFGSGYDYGHLLRRIYFKKTNSAEAVTVTITKSSDTSKYMLYWGATYWGTVSEPYATHLTASGRGGHVLSGLYESRIYDVTWFKPDLLMLEHTAINSAGGNPNMSVADSYVATLATLKSFLATNSVEWFTMLPNATTGLMTGYPAPTRRFWNYLKAGCLDQGIPVVDAERVMYKIWQFLYPDGSVTYPAWLQTCMYDGSTHPNSKGFSIFESLFQPIFDQI